jgi:hypothetical protein
MIARMTVIALVAFSLSSIALTYSTGRTPAYSQQPQSAHPSKALRILIEEDFSTAQALISDLADWSVRIGIPIIFVENDAEPYDMRILLASDVGHGSGSCSPAFAQPASASCSVGITLHFVSAVALTPDGKRLFTETGVGREKRGAVIPLARKLAKRLSVLPDAKASSTK